MCAHLRDSFGSIVYFFFGSFIAGGYLLPPTWLGLSFETSPIPRLDYAAVATSVSNFKAAIEMPRHSL